jgi:hypothetical protein
LARKTPKIDDKGEACKQCSVEALAYTCEHPSVIKFLAIHIETMEAYTHCGGMGFEKCWIIT